MKGWKWKERVNVKEEKNERQEVEGSENEGDKLLHKWVVLRAIVWCWWRWTESIRLDGYWSICLQIGASNWLSNFRTQRYPMVTALDTSARWLIARRSKRLRGSYDKFARFIYIYLRESLFTEYYPQNIIHRILFIESYSSCIPCRTAV